MAAEAFHPADGVHVPRETKSRRRLLLTCVHNLSNLMHVTNILLKPKPQSFANQVVLVPKTNQTVTVSQH